MVMVDVRRVVGYFVMLLAGVPALSTLSGRGWTPSAAWWRDVVLLAVGLVLIVSSWGSDKPAAMPAGAPAAREAQLPFQALK